MELQAIKNMMKSSWRCFIGPCSKFISDTSAVIFLSKQGIAYYDQQFAAAMKFESNKLHGAPNRHDKKHEWYVNPAQAYRDINCWLL
jgi:hypothetical protein